MGYVTSKNNMALAGVALGVGAGFGAAAPAATFSLAPPGFTPVVVTETTGSNAILDFSGKGKRNVFLSGQSPITAPEFGPGGKPTGNQKILQDGLITATTGGSVSFYVDGNGRLVTSRAAVVPAGTSLAASATVAIGNTSNFDGSPSYGFASYEGKADKNSGPTTIPGFPAGIGYIKGTFSNTSFTLLDYGRLSDPTTSDVPEPETWTLLTMGFAGVGAAMRRGRRAQQRRAAGC